MKDDNNPINSNIIEIEKTSDNATSTGQYGTTELSSLIK